MSSRRSATAIVEPDADGKIAATETRQGELGAARVGSLQSICDMITIVTTNTDARINMLDWFVSTRKNPGT